MKELKKLAQQLQQSTALMAVRYQGQSALLDVSVRADKHLHDLQHIERQKSAFLQNFEAFLHHRPYHHVLLWGARGTGKSTLVRASFLHYQQHYPEQLAIVQLDSQHLDDLAAMIWSMGRVSKRFVLFIDDVSFSLDDGRYKALKAVLDGAIAEIPHNVLLILTSNRRHLLRDEHQDDNAIHPEEDSEERISLAERFGLRLSFHPLSQEEYLAVVQMGLGEDWRDEEKQSALQFSLAQGSRSARVAMQFVALRQAQLGKIQKENKQNVGQSAFGEEKATFKPLPRYQAPQAVQKHDEDERCSKSCKKKCKKPCKKQRKKMEKRLKSQG
ncbi:MAG: DUF815 domain-containing protein [Cardiobacteriaceae bacterium]|nr:DUF815 domain-containing protein [Cardiobacteriaceae bacterium]